MGGRCFYCQQPISAEDMAWAHPVMGVGEYVADAHEACCQREGLCSRGEGH